MLLFRAHLTDTNTTHTYGSVAQGLDYTKMVEHAKECVKARAAGKPIPSSAAAATAGSGNNATEKTATVAAAASPAAAAGAATTAGAPGSTAIPEIKEESKEKLKSMLKGKRTTPMDETAAALFIQRAWREKQVRRSPVGCGFGITRIIQMHS